MVRTRNALALLLAASALVRAEHLPIGSYNATQGLAEGRVNAIVEDSRGFVWFATNGGISRFDGYGFVTWSVRPQVSYRGSFAFDAAPNGDFWVGSGKGLRRFGSGGPDRSDLLTPDSTDPSISDILRTRSGRLLVLNDAAIYQEAGGTRLESLIIPPGIRSEGGIGAIAEDLSGHLWVAVPSQGLLVYELSAHGAELRQTVPLPQGASNVNAMVEAPAGFLWVGSNAGLLRYQRSGPAGHWTYTGAFGVAQGIAGREVTALLRRSEGSIWIGTISGISRLAEADALNPRFRNIGRENGLSADRISVLTEDRAGNVWAGTDSAGVMLIKTQGFTTYQESDGIASVALHQVLEDRRGVLTAVGTGNGVIPRTLTFYDGERFHQNEASIFGSRPPWSWQRFLIQSGSGKWWAATDKGLCRFSAASAKELENARPEACYTDEKAFHVFEDSRGDVWASSPNNRLFHWVRDANCVLYLSPDGSESPDPKDFGQFISAMAEDRSGNLWLGGWNGGVYRRTGNRWQHFGAPEGAPRGSISTLLSDSSGRLWIGHARGLTVVQDAAAPTPHFIDYKSNGLQDTSITTVVEDRFGRIWAATVRGVVNLDPATGATHLFSTEDGLPPSTFTSSIRDRSGALWFSSSLGLTRTVPRPDTPSAPPGVVFTGIRVGDEDYLLPPRGAEHVPKIVLDPEKDHVEIQFAAPGVESALALRYQFLLDGADPTWSQPQPGNRVDYRHLTSGSYRFLVRAVGRNGLIGASAAEFDFRILPPFWQRWWFELPLAMAFLSAVYWLHSYRVTHLLAMERMRNNIAADLHDDIGASLARIAVLSEVARVHIESDPVQADAPLRRIGSAARELIDSLNDIVWSIGSAEAGIDSLLVRMREFALDVLEPGGVQFTLSCDEELRGKHIAPDVRRHLLLVFKECIHNTAKHSACRCVRAALSASPGHLTLTVTDDGCGLPAAAPARGNGIPGMNRRARAMRGEVEISGGPGAGCSVTVRIPFAGGLAATHAAT
jgi:ligand-binding sensor domain-containing protein/signal transduction histidine kinase